MEDKISSQTTFKKDDIPEGLETTSQTKKKGKNLTVPTKHRKTNVPKKYQLQCRRCGKTFPSDSHNTLYCSSCLELQHEDSRKRSRRKKKNTKTEELYITRNGIVSARKFLDSFEAILMQEKHITSYGQMQLWKQQNPELYLARYEQFMQEEGIETIRFQKK